MRLGYVQSAPVFGETAANVERSVELMSLGSAELWVLPELANTGYKFTSAAEARELAEPVPDGPSSRRWIDFARERGVSLVAGLAELADRAVYNSALVCSPEGHVATYRKTHLFDAENKWFAPGDTPPAIVTLAGARVGVMICFDWFFPEVARTLALLGADIIAHPANLVLPWCQRAMLAR